MVCCRAASTSRWSSVVIHRPSVLPVLVGRLHTSSTSVPLVLLIRACEFCDGFIGANAVTWYSACINPYLVPRGHPATVDFQIGRSRAPWLPDLRAAFTRAAMSGGLHRVQLWTSTFYPFADLYTNNPAEALRQVDAEDRFSGLSVYCKYAGVS